MSDFVRYHNGTEVRITDTLELYQWTLHLAHAAIPANEYNPIRSSLFQSSYRYKAIHHERLVINTLWSSVRLTELLEEWHRALETQQVFNFVLEDPQMEAETKRVID